MGKILDGESDLDMKCVSEICGRGKHKSSNMEVGNCRI